MKHDVPLPRLLDSSFNLDRELHPLTVSLALNLVPLSTASIELPKGENLPARSYVEVFSPLGSVGIFRVRSPEDAYGEDTTTAELEHAVSEVGDYLVKAEYSEMMVATTAMTTVFSHYNGGRWQLGSISALGSSQIALQVNYERVLDAMLKILEQTDCYMDFDFSTSPWTINFVQKSTTVTAEGRLSRNLDAVRIIYDDTELCTRAYYEYETTTYASPDGFPTFDVNKNYSKDEKVGYGGRLYTLPNGHTAGTSWAQTASTVVADAPTTAWTHMDADTIGTYGIVEKTVPVGTGYTTAETEAVVRQYLEQHKIPRFSVECTGEVLSIVTGESLDTFTLGKLMRLALVDYGVTIEHEITGLEWGDVYDSPEDVNIRLADEEDTLLMFLHDIDATGSTTSSRGGGGGGSNQENKWKEYYTRFEQDDYHFHLLAAHVDQQENILQQAGLYIDSNGVITYAEDNTKNIGSKFKVNADAISAEVTRATQAEGTLSGQITVEAGKISQIVQSVGADGQVTAASIVLAINQSTGQSEAKIDAGHVYIGNDKSTTVIAGKATLSDVTASYIQAQIATLASLNVASLTSERGGISVNSVGTTTFSQGGVTCYVPNGIWALRIVQSGNTYTLQRQRFSDSGWVDVDSFSRATSLSGTWSSNVWTVTASPQGNTISMTVEARISYSSALHRYTASVYTPNGTKDTIQSGLEAYNQGWNDCIAETRDNHPAGLYTRDTGVYGGSTVHYILSGSTYMNVGSGWYKTAYEGGYYLPDPKS